MKKIFILLLLYTSISLAQKTSYTNPKVVASSNFDITPELRTMQIIEPSSMIGDREQREIPIGRIPEDTIKSYKLLAADPGLQDYMGTSNKATTINNWEGMSFSNAGAGAPPDTQGDVGLNHYIQMVNSSFQIWDKSGNSLLGPADISSVFVGIGAPWEGTNHGDPIVLYDEEADRWLLSEFSIPNIASNAGPYAMLIAISTTGDPLGSWYRYVFEFTDMPDYPKFGVWNDGYYMSINSFDPINFTGGGAAVFDRSKMLVGDTTATMQFFDLAPADNAHSMLPAEFDGPPPPAGTPNYFLNRLSNNIIRIYSFTTDWTTPANSTFSFVSDITANVYDRSINGISQPGTTNLLDPLSDRLMFRVQYRYFGDYAAMVLNHSVDVDATDHAGVRWYELRNSGIGWSIYQQGTYAPDASSRWMGSIAIDGFGNIGLGYSVASSTIYPSIRYTGRHKDDPLGQMTITEKSIIEGAGSQINGLDRWGDYSMMSIDPADDATFWYTTEYIQSNGSFNWQTRIASFSLGADLSVKIILEGSYVASLMTTDLNNNGNLPRRQPYSNYSGAEKISTVDDPVNNIEDFYEDNPGIVDWVLVSLRTGTDANTEVQKRAGFVKEDGTVVGLDGSSPLRFGVPDASYYVVVEHRNHLSIMSSSAVPMANSSITSFGF